MLCLSCKKTDFINSKCMWKAFRNADSFINQDSFCSLTPLHTLIWSHALSIYAHIYSPLQPYVFNLHMPPLWPISLHPMSQVFDDRRNCCQISVYTLDPSSRKHHPCFFPQDALWHHPHSIVCLFMFKHFGLVPKGFQMKGTFSLVYHW